MFPCHADAQWDAPKAAHLLERLASSSTRLGRSGPRSLAVLDAGPMAMLFAASHPDRTTVLVLTARVVAADDYPCGLLRELAALVLERIEATSSASSNLCPETVNVARPGVTVPATRRARPRAVRSAVGGGARHDDDRVQHVITELVLQPAEVPQVVVRHTASLPLRLADPKPATHGLGRAHGGVTA